MARIVTIPADTLFHGAMKLLNRITKNGLSVETALVLSMTPAFKENRADLLTRIGQAVVEANPELVVDRRFPTKQRDQLADTLQLLNKHCLTVLTRLFDASVSQWTYGGRVGDTVFFYIPATPEPSTHAYPIDSRMGSASNGSTRRQ